MRVFSTFAGSGGFDLGLERAGAEVVGQCELDPYRSRVLRRHWPGVPLVPDVRDVRSAADLRGADLVCGGFPCRDLSVVGRRRGLEGAGAEDGSGLFFELVRVADLLGPGGWVLIENVPGLLSSNDGRDFAVVLAALAERGFHDLAWRVLDSRLHGVPQARRRVFILARRTTGDSARRVLHDAEDGRGDTPPGGDPGQELPPRAPGGDPPGVEELIAERAITRALTARLGTSGWDLTDAEGNLFVLAEDGRPRRLTPTECERLQGFPDGWTIPTGPSLREAPSWYSLPPEGRPRQPRNPPPHAPRYEAMGRAVTVPVAEAIGERLLAVG